MANIQINRIKSKLTELFSSIIYMGNIKVDEDSEEYKKMWYSRAYSAYSTFLLGAENVDEATKSVTDGFADNDIDAIYNDKNKKILYFIQTKFSNEANGSISEGDTLKFIKGVKKITTSDFSNFNDLIVAKQKEIEKALSDFNYRIEIIVCTSSNQNISSNSQEVIDDFLQGVNSDGSDDVVTYRHIKLNDVYDHMANQGVAPKIDFEDVVVHNWGRPTLYNDSYKVYYGWLSATDIVNWKEQYGDRIFEKNIRNFKQNTDVNNGILKVLREEPENFYLYNNGIKIISEKVEKNLKGVSTTDYINLKLIGASIINGAQTTGSLFEAYHSEDIDLTNVSVQVQIIVLGEDIDNIGPKITKLSNTQNRIENKDFAAQDKEQERLMKDLAIDGKQYVYRQGVELPNSDEGCDLDSATVALGCYLDDVAISTQMKRAYGSIFDNTNKPPYKLIFNSGTSAYKLWNCVEVYRELQNIEGEYQQDPNNQSKKLMSIHGNRFILHLIFQKLKNNPSLDFENGYITTFPNLTEEYCLIMEELIRAKEELYPEAYPANIFKNGKRTKELKEKMSF
ncbi:TPA: AIPR family protein [Streptococcus pyogenes]|nr:AIPR family protein [Streptococcus pyogenes]HES6459960.1 AIPR family protein [Streptococcus pyogenes]